MFRSIVDDHHERLAELATSFTKRGNFDAALLCFDHYFNQVPQLAERDIEKIARDLTQFANYVGALRDLAYMSGYDVVQELDQCHFVANSHISQCLRDTISIATAIREEVSFHYLQGSPLAQLF